MSYFSFKLPPGLDQESTALAEQGKWYDADKVRFIAPDGNPAKIGGWQNADGTNTFSGMARAVLNWIDLSANTNVAIATNQKLYIWRGGAYFDITPIRKTVNPLGNNPFATTSGSASVTVTDTSHGGAVGDSVIYQPVATFNNVTIAGEYTLVTVIDANSYTITAGTLANSTSSGGGAAVRADYLLAIGVADATPGLGYGAGGYGLLGYGDPRSSSTVTLDPRGWSLDLYGQDLIATVRSGETYYWTAPNLPQTLLTAELAKRAQVVSANAPTHAEFGLVSMPDRHLVLFGADDAGVDKMNIKWSDQENLTVWDATETNQAGSQRITGGSRIVAACRTRGQILIFTDTDLHGMQFLGPPFIFGFQQLATGCGVLSPHSMVDYNGVVYWLGSRDFYVYDGRVRVLPCTLKRAFFDRLNQMQDEKVFAFVNPAFNEVWWLYPSGDECDNYIAYDIGQNVWHWGTLDRTAGQGVTLFSDPTPFLCGSNGHSYYHETGTDDDGAAMTTFIQSGDLGFGEGNQLIFGDKLIPDFIMSGQLELTVQARNYPNASAVTKGPFTVTSATQKIDTRIRGRQANLKIASADIGDAWRAGVVRLNIQPDGRR